jgi:hypothetical protein
MGDVVPRYEFRTFNQSFPTVMERIRQLAPCDWAREGAETYILSTGTDNNNCKIRRQLLDIKTLLKRERGLEQWRPLMKDEFPIDAAVIRRQVFPALGVPSPPLQRERYTLARFLDELIRPHSGLLVVDLYKRRFGFNINQCIVEHAEVKLNDSSIQTLAVESADPDAVLETRKLLGLDGLENVCYPLALKRITGLV